MDFEQYEQQIERLAKLWIDDPVHLELEKLLESNDPTAHQITLFRQQNITNQDRENAQGFLELSFFSNLVDDEKIAAMCVTFEIEKRRNYLSYFIKYRPYSISDPIFSTGGIPFKSVYKNDLIPVEMLDKIELSGHVRFLNNYFKIDSLINGEILKLLESFPTCSSYIRVNPLFISLEKPPLFITAAAIRPASPKWFSQFDLDKPLQGAVYVLLVKDKKEDNGRSFWERELKGIVKLEFSIKKTKDKVMITVEELSDHEKEIGLLLGRMIHLDLLPEPGKGFLESTLGHIDLAINIYEGKTCQERLNASLHTGVKVPATTRSHLIRIGNAPAAVFFALAFTFFQSEILLNEWFSEIMPDHQLPF